MKPEASRTSPTSDPTPMAGLASHRSGTAGGPVGDGQRKVHGLATLATWAGMATAMVGGGHLVAWLTGWMAERGLATITMKANTALCLVLLGVALVLLVPLQLGRARLWAGRACAALALLIGALTLSEHIIGWDLGIDQLLAEEPPGALGAPSPNRMGPPASISATLAGLALLLLSRRDGRQLRAAQGLALAVCMIALLSCIGYLYGALAFYGMPHLTGIAWPTAAALLVLGVGLLCARPAEGLMAQVTADDPGGLIIRHLLIPILVLVVAIGWLRVAGERLGYFDAAQGAAMRTLISIIIFGALIYYTGRRLSRSAADLRQSEERFAAFMRHLPGAAWMKDLQGRYVFVNTKAESIFGKTRQELQGRTDEELFPPETAEQFHANDHRVLVEGSVETTEVLRQPDGLDHHSLVSKFTISGSGGQPICIGGVAFDITQRSLAEQALRTRMAAIDAAADMVVITDPNGTIQYVNPAFTTITGYSPQEAIGQTPRLLKSGVHDADFYRDLWQTILAGRTWHGEVTNRRKDGTYYHEEMTITPVSGEDGRIINFVAIKRDVTDRKRAEEALRESEIRYHTLFDSIDEGFCIIEVILDENEKAIDFRFLETNPSFAKQTGLVHARGKTMRELVPKHEEHWFETYGRVALTGRPARFQNRAEQLHRWYDVYAFRLGQPERRQVAILFNDITARKQTEDALAESRQRLAGIVDSAMDAIITVDEQQRIVQFNPAAEKMFRCPADQALGAHIEHFIPHRFREAHREHIREFGQTGQTSRAMGHLGAISGLRLDGGEFPIEASISQVEVGGHKLFSVILRDITERKRAEEVLRQSEEKFRALAEHTRASFGIIQGTRFVYANPYLAEVSGYTVPELLSMEFPQVVHPDFRPIMMERARRRQMGEPVPNHYEFKLLTKSGDVRWMDFSVGTILYEGKLAVIGSGFDVTEHKRAMEALRESQQQLQEVNLHLEQRVAERTAEAEHRSEQLRELASELTRAEQHERSRVASILHDHLQQLLVGAKFGMSVLRGRLDEEPQRQALRKVDDLLDESLETSRNLTIELSPPILKEGTLAGALHWLAGWMHDKHSLQVHLKMDETLDPHDEGVRILLFESVRELLFNIVKHAGTDSACMTLERCNSEHLRIIVADAGPGFDVGLHSRHDRAGGGFGLFSIRERLGLIGGRFEIDSAPGQGAQMTLVAPLRLQSAEPVAQASAGLPPAAQVAAALLEVPTRRATVPGECTRIRVLVADDHAVVRDGIAQLLQMHADVEVVGLASDGQHAVELAMDLRPDVILMDVSMPRLNGIDATRRVRQELPRVCVIGLSMHAEDEMAARMREAGAACYLAKTAPPDAVVAAIRGCVSESTDAARGSGKGAAETRRDGDAAKKQ